MNMDEAVRRAFETLAASDLVTRLLLWDTTLNPEKPMIVVFTGYGLALSDFAREVSDELANAPIFVLGPNNLGAADPAKRTQDAVTYRTRILSRDEEAKRVRRVLADASNDTQSTLGQATVAARLIEEEGVETALLVTAAYHQPRAYMTLLKSLIKRGIEGHVRLVPKAFGLSRDWDAEDSDLKDRKSWASAFGDDELPRIIEYQRKGDVASWKELQACLERLKRSS
jgi:hypothetical protein